MFGVGFRVEGGRVWGTRTRGAGGSGVSGRRSFRVHVLELRPSIRFCVYLSSNRCVFEINTHHVCIYHRKIRTNGRDAFVSYKIMGVGHQNSRGWWQWSFGKKKL